MPQFFIDEKIRAGGEIAIRGRDARHISQSLRLGPGDEIVLSDGRGRSFRSRIIESGRSRVVANVEEEIVRPAGRPPPALAIASIRGERLEWAIQKAVELGCRRIILFDSERTVRKTKAEAGSRRMERLRRIAAEAAKQSGAPFAPEVEGPTGFEELCGRLSEFNPRIILHEAERDADLCSALPRGRAPDREGIIIIGPEGGFTDEEVALARSCGAASASLGHQILRVETAAVAALAIYQFEIGNMGIA